MQHPPNATTLCKAMPVPAGAAVAGPNVEAKAP